MSFRATTHERAAPPFSHEVLGMTPTTIRFAVGECSRGSILVAATEKGVCAILLGDNPEALGLELPLDVRGTAFQQRVWQALREIPAGATASYGDIAGHISLPNAVREVAQACASHAIAVTIPCHRVVRNDGTLSGYQWGVARKRVLLHREVAS
jgi:AraC family transcriptional regulator, regulatory protein of adaptative response / methylated-DNA-[protein]-cysteine methyltransferase